MDLALSVGVMRLANFSLVLYVLHVIDKEWRRINVNDGLRSAKAHQVKVEALYDLAVELSNIIENSYKLVKSLEDKDLKELYLLELEPLVLELGLLNADLMNALEDYFTAERAENLPVNLTFKSLYKQLRN